MIILLIEKAYGTQFSMEDHKSMDIKPDVHTTRVLYRLGVSRERNENSTVKDARELNPLFPGEIDGALWVIGKRWCHESNPDCNNCYVTTVCNKVID